MQSIKLQYSVFAYINMINLHVYLLKIEIRTKTNINGVYNILTLYPSGKFKLPMQFN